MSSTPQIPDARRKLNSWKEIADYLQRDVRTVTRWEQEKGLPVHRAPGVGRQSVFAFTDEIDAWLREPVPMAAYQLEPPAAKVTPSRNWPLFAAVILIASVAAAAGWWRGYRPGEDSANSGRPGPPSSMQFAWPNGKIEFAVHRIETGGIAPSVAAVADLNRDGIPDIATASLIGSSVAVLEGRGDETFAAPKVYASCSQIHRLEVADFDADGALDLLTSCYESQQIRVLWGSPTDPFTEYSALATAAGTRAIAVADLNGDGKPDIAASSFVGGALSVFLNRGSRKFSSSSMPLEIGSGSLTLQDVDGDKKLDLISCSVTTGNLLLLKGRGDGRFDGPKKLGQFRATWLHTSADLDGDGVPEIVVPELGGGIIVLNSKSAAILQRMEPKVEGPFCMVVADFNGDSKVDILGALSWKEHIVMLAGGMDGHLVPAGQQRIGRYPYLGAAGDLNRDGVVDAVIPLAHEHALAVLIQKRTSN